MLPGKQSHGLARYTNDENHEKQNGLFIMIFVTILG